MPLRTAGNFRVVLCRGDGSEAGCLVAFAAVITFAAIIASHQWVLPDSCYGVCDSFGARSRRRAVAVADFLRGRSHPYPSPSCFHSRSRSEWSALLDSAQV